MMTAELDTTRFIAAMGQVHDALIGAGNETDAKNLVRDESRRLVQQIMRFTPPKDRRQGEQAIERELGSLFSEAAPMTIDEIGSKHGLRQIDAFLTKKDGTKLPIHWDNLDPMGQNMQRYHHHYQNRRGRVPINVSGNTLGDWRARVVIPIGSKQAYIDKIKKRVGRWKASWAKLATELGLSVPSWISGHLPSPHAIGDISGLNDSAFPVITLGSRAPGVGSQADKVRAALRVRSVAMVRRAALIVSGYNKDLARGMRVAARKQREGGDE